MLDPSGSTFVSRDLTRSHNLLAVSESGLLCRQRTLQRASRRPSAHAGRHIVVFRVFCQRYVFCFFYFPLRFLWMVAICHFLCRSPEVCLSARWSSSLSCFLFHFPAVSLSFLGLVFSTAPDFRPCLLSLSCTCRQTCLRLLRAPSLIASFFYSSLSSLLPS